MISKCIILLLLVFSLINAHAQFSPEAQSRGHWKDFGFIKSTNHIHHLTARTCGIYGTSDDLASGNLSLAIDCRSEDHKIKTGFVGDRASIKVVRKEETVHYLKGDVYGYRDCHGNEYHFFEGKSYQQVNPGESIPIYRVFEWRGKQRVAKHFFRGASPGTVKPLTLENLSDEFSDETYFLEKLHLLAENDFQLVRYMYAINQVRLNTLSEKGAGAL